MSATQQPALNVATVLVAPMVARKSIEHLKSYTFIKNTIEWYYYIPFTRRTKDVMTPTIKIIRNTQPLKAAYDTGDLFLDNILTRLDNYLQNPEVTNTVNSICRPLRGTVDSTDKTVRSTDEMIMKQVVEPTQKTMATVVESISKPRVTSNNTTTGQSKPMKKVNQLLTKP